MMFGDNYKFFKSQFCFLSYTCVQLNDSIITIYKDVMNY